MDTQTKLKELQARSKVLQSAKEQIIRDLGSNERKMAEAAESLRKLGFDDAESMSVDDIRSLIVAVKASLETNMEEVERAIIEGESLLGEKGDDI